MNHIVLHTKNIFINFKTGHNRKIHMVFIPMLLSLFSCEDFVEVDPPRTEISRVEVFESDGLANSAISGIYVDMFAGTFASEMNRNNGLLADDLLDYTETSDFINNSLMPMTAEVNTYWGELYNYIYSANSIIEGLEASTKISLDLKNQLEGESKFVRALCHFYLLNLFGDVPLIIASDFRANNVPSRTGVSEVYDQILRDLDEAEQLLSDDFSFSGGDRARPNKYAAIALLARVHLYLGNWEDAELWSSMVIEASDFELVTDLNEVSLLNNNESIWQLRSTLDIGSNVRDASFYILESAPTLVSLREELVNTFEVGDNRRTDWIGEITVDGITYYYAFKYKVRDDGTQPITESLAMLRLAEQYLIRAEARAQLGDFSGAQSDINVIRNRAGLGNTTANDQNSLLDAILNERRLELFTEGSHRWLDLKRTGRADEILGPLKSGWQATDVLYPIPFEEININPNLTQNPGY